MSEPTEPMAWEGLPGDERITVDGVRYITIRAALVGLEKIAAQRDAWKEAHENLLEVRRQDLAALQARIGVLLAERDKLQAELEACKENEKRWSKLVGELYMAALQHDNYAISELGSAFKITFPDGAPYATLREPIDAARNQEPT